MKIPREDPDPSDAWVTGSPRISCYFFTLQQRRDNFPLVPYLFADVDIQPQFQEFHRLTAQQETSASGTPLRGSRPNRTPVLRSAHAPSVPPRTG
jgi:hypothetical protein